MIYKSELVTDHESNQTKYSESGSAILALIQAKSNKARIESVTEDENKEVEFVSYLKEVNWHNVVIK